MPLENDVIPFAEYHELLVKEKGLICERNRSIYKK